MTARSRATRWLRLSLGDPLAVAQWWLDVRPIKRLKAWRKARKAMRERPADEAADEFFPTEGSAMNQAVVVQIVLAVLRHGMTALAPLGIVVSDDWLTQTAALVVGAVGLAWSAYRKTKA